MADRIDEYVGVGPEEGTVVGIADAFKYALWRCLFGTPEERQEFRKMLVEWYYSGNWIGLTQEEIKERGGYK